MADPNNTLNERERQIFAEIEADLTHQRVGRGARTTLSRWDRSVVWAALGVVMLALVVLAVLAGGVVGVTAAALAYLGLVVAGVRGWGALERRR